MTGPEYSRSKLHPGSEPYRFHELERAFAAGVREGHRRERTRESLRYLAARGSLPTYHQLLDQLCSELGVPGSPSFGEALAHVRERLSLPLDKPRGIG